MSIDREVDKEDSIQWNVTEPLKKEWNNAICSYMDGTRDCHTELIKSDIRRNLYDITYKWNLKRYELTKQKQIHRLRELTYGY